MNDDAGDKRYQRGEGGDAYLALVTDRRETQHQSKRAVETCPNADQEVSGAEQQDCPRAQTLGPSAYRKEPEADGGGDSAKRQLVIPFDADDVQSCQDRGSCAAQCCSPPTSAAHLTRSLAPACRLFSICVCPHSRARNRGAKMLSPTCRPVSSRQRRLRGTRRARRSS